MHERSRPKAGGRTGIPVQLPPLRPEWPFLTPVRPEQAPEAEHELENVGLPALEVRGVYIISVAARILEMHPQTLRKYERLGLINPDRTGGMLRLYSRDDIRKILLIRHLMDNLGLNLAGVEFALNLVDNLFAMRERLSAAAEGSEMLDLVEQEMARLSRNLNLPLER